MLDKPDEIISWIKDNLKNDTPLRTMYLSKRSDLFLLWADALEQKIKDGSLEIEIHKIGRHIRRELIEIDLDQAIVYMYEILPAKFKHHSDEQEDAADDLLSPKKSAKPTEKVPKTHMYHEENAEYIRRLRESVELLERFADSLDERPFCTKVEDLDEYFLRWDNTIARAKETLDGREKVPVTTQHLLFYAFSHSTLNHAYSNYLLYVKELAEITSKQAGKILRGHVSRVQLLYDPKTRVESLNSGFYGASCESCGSWRTAYKYNTDASEFMVKCYACGNWQPAITEPLLTNQVSN